MGKNKAKKKSKPAVVAVGKTTLRKTPLFSERKEVFGKSYKKALDRLEMRHADAYYRQSMFGHEIIWNGERRHYSFSQSRDSYKYFYIFALVKKDALKYLKEHKIKRTEWLNSTHKNKKMEGTRKKVTGVDIDTAYWDIALRLGIISEKTYDAGILIPNKGLGHAAISSLGKDTGYTIIRDGKLTNDQVIVLGDEELKGIYYLIRMTCFKYLRKLAKILGPNDYVEQKTDAIFYIDNERNNRIVHEFMEKHNFDYKPGLRPRTRSKN